jgi:hypothetical protein
MDYLGHQNSKKGKIQKSLPILAPKGKRQVTAKRFYQLVLEKFFASQKLTDGQIFKDILCTLA